ncbi:MULTISPECIES: site-specific integrase [unclassified Enterococcus]|jgi:integrase/recombinase XerD|uniref:tyrosine-type recombinase/integrase n=1 Tax=unclassified Enterococcus TaxID=2608891 RepID=UPI00112446FD|nr:MULTISPECIES: site-specific integrase [unclassified Enterococcus]TPE02109.1 integrase [Enterococcus sp. PF-3]TPE25542.1 integrase [Enterococcus sp. PF-2]
MRWFVRSPFLLKLIRRGFFCMEWEEIIVEFCLDITVRGFSKITIKNYKSKLSNTAKFFKSINVCPSNLKKTHVSLWILDMQEKQMQASTINLSVSRMKKLYDYMLKENYVENNPFERIERLKEQTKVIYPLNDFEIKQMLSAARNHRYKYIAQRNVVILMLMIECGLRISEVCEITDEDIMSNQILIKNSKNNKDRAVAISPIIKKEIIKYQRLKKKKYGSIKGNPFIISNKSSKLNEKAIWQIMQEIKKEIQVRSCVRFSGHTLRHTYASMQLRNGLDIYTLSLNMGHSTIQMTQRYVQTLNSGDFIEKSIRTSTLMNLR